MKKRIVFIISALIISIFLLSSCSPGGSQLDPSEPVTLTMWHVYGEQAESPMNRLIEDFNDTAGRDAGVIINVTSMTNSNDVGQELLDSFSGAPGASDMPDLFFCHPNNAADLGVENLVDWQDLFTGEELDSFVDDFITAGMEDDRLVVFPVSKSTYMMFINDTQFRRFAEDTGHSYDDLKTWKGFYRTAADYREWSGGKTFCAFDYPLTTIPLYATAQEPEKNYRDGWLDFSSGRFRDAWLQFASAMAQGDVIISDLYSNTQIMTGEVVSGISSSAAILYFNDTVTYPDNTSEPLDLHIMPVPQASSGEHQYAQQAGVGLCALSTDDVKAEAASVFAHWLTETDRNLEFVTQTGYMPVHKDAYEKLETYDFSSSAYEELYSSLAEIRENCTFVSEKNSNSDYYPHIFRVYEVMRKHQVTMHENYLDGESAERLSEDSWKILRSID